MRRSRTPAARSRAGGTFGQAIWGTTAGGFDVFSRVVWGTSTAIIAIIVAVLSIFAGVLLGLVSGYLFGGWVDRVLVMIADAIYSFPSLLLAISYGHHDLHGQSGLWSGISLRASPSPWCTFRSISVQSAPK